jgi:hypothetical protein
LGHRAQEGIAISRAQATQAFNTASSENSTNFGNSQSAFGDTQNDIGDYKSQLAKYVSGNPYQSGGEYSQTINSGLSNASDAGSNSLKGALQSQSMRTGQNSAAGLATAASGAEANTRNLSSSLASADQQRINSEAGYNAQALSATAEPISAESNLYGTSGGQADSELGTEQKSSTTPSFWDEVGQGVASGLGGALTAGGAAYGKSLGGKCFVAAELFGGWDDPRVSLLREWIFGPFSQKWWGKLLANFYSCHGQRMAAFIRVNKFGRRIAQFFFDRALILAREWK